MKSLLTLLLTTVGFSKPPAEPIDLGRMVEAIVEIEGGRWTDIGGAGCMSYAAWSQHTTLPYYMSNRQYLTRMIYRDHLNWTVRQLMRHGVAVTPASVYLVWRRGLEGACAILRRSGMPEQSIRCQNLYYDSGFPVARSEQGDCLEDRRAFPPRRPAEFHGLH